MLILRIVGVIAAVLAGAGILAWMFSGDRKYLNFSWQVARFSVALALIMLVLLALERLLPL